MIWCTVGTCEDKARFDVLFTTGDTYSYCNYHGSRFTQGWVNRGHRFSEVESWSYTDHSKPPIIREVVVPVYRPPKPQPIPEPESVSTPSIRFTPLPDID